MEPHKAWGGDVGRSAAFRALALALFFVALKLYLFLWYRAAGTDVLSEVPPLARVALCGPDLLASMLVALVAVAVATPALFLRARSARVLFADVAPALLFGAATVLAAVSFKANQSFGRPLDFGLLDFAAGLGAMRDSIVAYVDLPFLVSLSMGLALVLRAPHLGGKVLAGVSTRALVLAMVLAGTVGGASAFSLFRHVYASGLKTNPLIELARSYHSPPRPEDYAAKLRELDAALAGHGEAVLDHTSLHAPGTTPGRPELRGKAAGSNLLLVVLESSSAEYVDARSAPTLTRLAAEGIWFQNHFTTAPFTFTSQYSLYYSNHLPFAGFAPRQAYGGPPMETSLFQVFKAAGYRTGLFCSAFLYFGDLGWLFESKGVDSLNGGEQLMGRGRPTNSWGVEEPQTVEALSSWLAQHRQERFFAVYNPVIPHHPYHAPLSSRPFPGFDVVANYRNALFYEDSQVAQVLEALKRNGLERNTVVAVVSDHGESVGSRHGSGHGFEFSMAELHIPFLLWAPGLIAQGQRETLATDHLDIAPTLVSLFGLPRPAEWSGRDLLEPQVPRRTLFVGLGAGNHLGLIDNGVAYERDLNEHLFHAYALQPGRFEPTSLPEPLERRYQEAVRTFEDKLVLHHLALALSRRSAAVGAR